MYVYGTEFEFMCSDKRAAGDTARRHKEEGRKTDCAEEGRKTDCAFNILNLAFEDFVAWVLLITKRCVCGRREQIFVNEYCTREFFYV